MQKHFVIGMLYLAAGCTGFAFDRLGLPLPWMIGPLVATALLMVTGTVMVGVPIVTRPFGQVVVATFVGAHFTPEAFHSLLVTAPVMIGVGIYIVVVSILVARVQVRVYRTDTTTAFLSVVPTSPVEAGLQAELFGVPPGPVIFAQTVRIAIVVTMFPLVLYAVGETGIPATLAPTDHSLPALFVTLAGATAGPLVFHRLGLANPFFLGPLFAAAALSAWGQPHYDIPGPVLSLAQVILGTWLGSCFRRDLLKQGSRLVSSILLTTGLLIALCILGAWALAALTRTPFVTLMLGIAPGGVTEMALTAGIIGGDVAMVTTMHLARIFIIMPNLPWLTRITGRQARPRAGED